MMMRAAADPNDTGRVPRHVAIIMDGNGRWASARHLPKLAGHKAGGDALKRTIQASAQAGIEWLTIYAFSSENWGRPEDEVGGLMGLMKLYLRGEFKEMKAQGVRLRIIGDLSRFASDLRAEIEGAVAETEHNTRLNLNVALSYGGRDEIVRAVKRIAATVKDGRFDPDTLTEDLFATALDTHGIPDPDLIIRTSGEVRLSNFLLWQSAYAELVFQDVLWPDYGAEHLQDALNTYAQRERRYGRR